jgi:hypothetical protein
LDVGLVLVMFGGRIGLRIVLTAMISDPTRSNQIRHYTIDLGCIVDNACLLVDSRSWTISDGISKTSDRKRNWSRTNPMTELVDLGYSDVMLMT